MSEPSNEPIASHFIKQWLHDVDCFFGIHDRKLYFLGLCTLISLSEAIPAVLSEVSGKIIPSLILVFDGLKCVYESRAQEKEDEEEEEDEECEEALSSDENDIREFSSGYLEQIADYSKSKADEAGFDMKAKIKDEDDESDDEEEESLVDL
uniref:Importin-7/11-like TPR repeats domain-containing protein n=1 Tax=Glossina brevipalpis TaxID=37001 RepID=A0A1A9WKD1_9MUSC